MGPVENFVFPFSLKDSCRLFKLCKKDVKGLFAAQEITLVKIEDIVCDPSAGFGVCLLNDNDISVENILQGFFELFPQNIFTVLKELKTEHSEDQVIQYIAISYPSAVFWRLNELAENFSCNLACKK